MLQYAPAHVLRYLRYYAIPQGFQLSHPSGNPMSQQTNAGLNCPECSICRPDVVTIIPVGVSGDGLEDASFFCVTVASESLFAVVLCVAPCAWWSRVAGVGQFAATWRLRYSVLRFVASLLGRGAPSVSLWSWAVGVDQLATNPGNGWSPLPRLIFGPPFAPSVACGVGQFTAAVCRFSPPSRP